MIASPPLPTTNKLLDELDLVVIEVSSSETMLLDGGSAETDAVSFSVSVSISGSVSISSPPSIGISAGGSVSFGWSWDKNTQY